MVVKGIPRPVVDDEQLEVAVVEEIAGVAPLARRDFMLSIAYIMRIYLNKHTLYYWMREKANKI